ncbi:hypothetical protein ID850_11130 [Xenorhabdus sp. Flor]|uniref:hypothetical protein n=1 Tax=Xenorhabdus cabanillasii TaxID=351673 RepID=UPI001997FD85|nr:hypothetical protein [Xenorhabdus sp. Flor]MBD2815310.1 hypothetical protein [Xenorhabdus sp. Flor]
MHSPTNAWEQELLSVHTRLAPLFHHPGPQQRSLAYLRGLLSDVERKNGWQLYSINPGVNLGTSEPLWTAPSPVDEPALFSFYSASFHCPFPNFLLFSHPQIY